MKIKTLVDEDFINYKQPSMFIGTSYCGGKCCIEAGIPISVCQNDTWRSEPPLDISNDQIIERYLKNDITHAIVFGGLEPFEQSTELIEFIDEFRNKWGCDDTVVIYTGYNYTEIAIDISVLQRYKNIIVKYGRFIPNIKSRFDEVLGVTLISENQYAEKIS